MEYENKIITIKGTNFIFDTNFEGRPDDKYGSTDRVANVIVPPAMVPQLETAGINVKSYPRNPEEGQQITYYVKVKSSWRYKNGDVKPEKFWPRIRTYEGRNTEPIDLDEESVKMIDSRNDNIEEISVRLNPWVNPNGGTTLFIQDLSVLFTPYGDPFGDLYGKQDDGDESEPF